MSQYTIAERQAIKDRLADEKYFEQDLELFAKLFPHHVLVGECKRVNAMNRPSLDKRMIYHMLTKIDQAQIIANRSHGITKNQTVQNVKTAAAGIAKKATDWIRDAYRKAKSHLSGE